MESQMFHFWFYATAVMLLILSAESQANSVNCPLIDVEVATFEDVRACVQSLTKRSFTEYCNAEETQCELDVDDCNETDGTHRLLCIWRNCVVSCSLMNDQPETCIESCFGVNGECDSSRSVQEMIDCHIELSKKKPSVDESKIICPILTQTLSNLEDCMKNVSHIKLEMTCQELGSACKYADIEDCKSSMRNHWFDTRLLCVATHCNRICSRSILCKQDCIGKYGCNNRKGEDLLLCHIETSKKFISDHKHFEPIVPEPTSYNKRKLVDCSIMFSIVNKSYALDKTHEILTDCILMMIIINMDIYYCHLYPEDCLEITDDCKQAKPLKLPYAYLGYFKVQKLQVDTYLTCLGRKCSKECSEQWKGNVLTGLKCRADCIGDIEKCLNEGSGTERLFCHIDHAAKFIEEGQRKESSAGDGQKSQTVNGEKSKVQVTVALLTVTLFQALVLIFNDSLF